MNPKESLMYSSIVGSFRNDIPLFPIEELLSQRSQDLHFALRCNGYFFLDDGNWAFNAESTKLLTEEFRGQRVAFFGPNSNDVFYSGEDARLSQLNDSFLEEPVGEIIRKYREVDEDQASRLAFLFGGIVRYLGSSAGNNEVKNAVKFAARMTKLGEQRSADAVLSAMAMYIISGGSLEEDTHFVGNVYHMAEAIREDPISVQETRDLGLSQVARLRAFTSKIQGEENSPFPDIREYEAVFEGFPTVGAEFHFPIAAAKEYPNFWQRLALLNMSQYQRGSYVQFCRNDQGVIEVRMNPSIYPIAIATWNYMRFLLPEPNQSFFTVTINRPDENFNWSGNNKLLNSLRALGLLTYAGVFGSIPKMGKSEQIDFGQVYLGQTVKMHDGNYESDGNWMAGEGLHGQFALHIGYGDIFPHLAYYLSMALADPDVFGYSDNKFLVNIKNLTYAMTTTARERQRVFQIIQNHIQTNPRLNNASEAGSRIIELLTP